MTINTRECWDRRRPPWPKFMMKYDYEILLKNTQHLFPHSFCATGMNSRLTTSVTLTQVSHRRLGESITGDLICILFNFCTGIHYCCWTVFWMVMFPLRWKYLYLNDESGKGQHFHRFLRNNAPIFTVNKTVPYKTINQ